MIIACLTSSIVLIKLQMDHHVTDPSLQKSSPEIDPAVFYQFTTEVSAQASALASHQQQLGRLTSLTEELVKTLQALQLSPSAMNPPMHNPPPPAPVTASPRLAFPEKFDGSPSRCKGFLLQCSMFVNQQPTLYSTDENRIAFVCSLLTGRALEWATAVWSDERTVFPSFTRFLQRFREVFEHPAGGKEVGEQLLALRQGRSTAADYALSFRTLSAQTGWADDPLKLLFRKGLSMELQSELACRDEGRSLDQFIDLAIQIDNLVRSRRQPRFLSASASMTSPPEPEPMQVGFTHLSTEERERRISHNLCLYCGLPGHLRASCPTRPLRNPPSVSKISTLSSVLEIPVTLRVNGEVIETTALIDSGAAGNFIDSAFSKTHRIPLVACVSRLAVAALDGRPLGSGRIQFTTEDLSLCTGAFHMETIRLFVFQSPQTPIILGLPWLEKHNPTISWPDKQITHWSEGCRQHCLDLTLQRGGEVTAPHSTHRLPVEYHDLIEAFSKTKASQLPPHRSNDCAIELQPNSHPPRAEFSPCHNQSPKP